MILSYNFYLIKLTKMTKKNKILILLFGIILLVVEACQKDYNYVLPPVVKVPPKVSVQTTTLEASFTSTPPNTTNAAFWKTANYISIASANMSTNFLYNDGLLNMTGTYKGLTDFSRGGDPKITIKATGER